MKTLTQEELHKHLRGLCDAKTQSDIADELGFTKAYINDLYHGKRLINAEVAGRLGYEMKINFKKVNKSVDTES